MSEQEQQIGRLAMRMEGDWWVAYFAAPTSMEGALELGRIKLRLVEDKDRKEAFMAIFQSFIGELIKEKTGREPSSWDRSMAPEHERSGSA